MTPTKIMTRIEFLATGIIAATAASPFAKTEPVPPACDHISWVGDCLRRIETIKPGMTRIELLSVFKTEGGLSNRTRRTYVSKGCPYFKVDVDFAVVGGADGGVGNSAELGEGSLDLIAGLSRPYLQFTIAD